MWLLGLSNPQVLGELKSFNRVLMECKFGVASSTLKIALIPAVTLTVHREPDSDIDRLREFYNDKTLVCGRRACAKAGSERPTGP